MQANAVPIFAFLFLLLHFFHQRRDYKHAFLVFQIKMLWRRLDVAFIIPDVKERKELIALAGKFNHDVDDCLEVVTPDTYRKWLAKKAAGKEQSQVGRKPTEGEAKKWVLDMKGENPSWGFLRITGELKKIGLLVPKSTVKRILERDGPPEPTLGPNPRKQPQVPWEKFLIMYADSIFGCDFIKQKIYSIRHGVMEAFMLTVIHHKSRRVYCSPATCPFPRFCHTIGVFPAELAS